MEEPGFWDDPDRSTKLMKEAKNLKDTVNGFKALEQEYEDISVMIEMGYEENDPELIPEIAQMLEELELAYAVTIHKSGCTAAGQTRRVLPRKCWIIWTVMRRGSSL